MRYILRHVGCSFTIVVTLTHEDLLQALDTLDSSGLLPSICCEVTQLYRIPPISLDQVAEEVHSNTKALKDLSSTIACLDKKVTSLVDSHSASVYS